MTAFKFRSWVVTPEGIHWDGTTSYFVSKETLTDSIYDEGRRIYDWPVNLAIKSWVTEEDLYAFNSAFIFALEFFNKGISPEISFLETLLDQQKIYQERMDLEVSDELMIGGEG